MPECRAATIKTPHHLLRDNHAATIMVPPRRRDSHPDCRRLPIQIAALQPTIPYQQHADVKGRKGCNKSYEAELDQEDGRH
jgi:hypothetical protein